MSFPISADREALRRALHAQLSDVLLDAGGSEHRQWGSAMGSQTASRVGFSRLDTLPLPPSQADLYSQTLGFQLPSLSSVGSSLGLGANQFFLSAAAAAAEQKVLDQARAALIQQRLAQQERERAALIQESALANLLRTKTSFPSQGAHGGLAMQLFGSQLLSSQPKASSAPVQPPEKANTNALEALGSSLRSKTDPYIDVSNITDPDPKDSALKRTRGGVAEPFPEKLHRMLKEVEEDGKSDIVSFFSHGRAFAVHDMERFMDEIMPKYFKQSKWNSFARQLNLYGFIRITSGPDAGGYYHELFLKGRPNLCLHMRRVGVPQGEDRRKMKPKNNIVDPDFYSMKPVEEKTKGS